MSHNLLKQLTSYSLLPCTQDKIYQETTHMNNNTNKFKGVASSKSESSGKSPKFYVNVKENTGLTKQDHQFIIDQCLNIHPDNFLCIYEQYAMTDQ